MFPKAGVRSCHVPDEKKAGEGRSEAAFRILRLSLFTTIPVRFEVTDFVSGIVSKMEAQYI